MRGRAGGIFGITSPIGSSIMVLVAGTNAERFRAARSPLTLESMATKLAGTTSAHAAAD